MTMLNKIALSLLLVAAPTVHAGGKAPETCDASELIPTPIPEWLPAGQRCCIGKFGPNDEKWGQCDTSSCPNNFGAKNRNCHNYGSPQFPAVENPEKHAGSANCPYVEKDQAICDVSYFTDYNGVSCRNNPNSNNGKNHCLGRVKCGSTGIVGRHEVGNNGKKNSGSEGTDAEGLGDPSLATSDEYYGECNPEAEAMGLGAGAICFYDGNSDNFKVCGGEGTSGSDEPVCMDKNLDFDGLARGTYVTDQFSEDFGATITCTGQYGCRIFDTAVPVGEWEGGDYDCNCSGNNCSNRQKSKCGDPDLGAPNEKCPGGGPGEGKGGKPNGDGPNCEALGNVLVVDEGGPGYPPDDRVGGEITFTFATPIDTQKMCFLDVDDAEVTFVIIKFADGSPDTDRMSAPNVGDNGYGCLDLPYEGVSEVVVDFTGSGSVSSFEYTICEEEQPAVEEPTVEICAQEGGSYSMVEIKESLAAGEPKPGDTVTIGGVEFVLANDCSVEKPEDSTCPVDMPEIDSVCNFHGDCPYGEETCCDGTTHASMIMQCIASNDGGFITVGYSTDACMMVECEKVTVCVEDGSDSYAMKEILASEYDGEKKPGDSIKIQGKSYTLTSTCAVEEEETITVCVEEGADSYIMQEILADEYDGEKKPGDEVTIDGKKYTLTSTCAVEEKETITVCVEDGADSYVMKDILADEYDGEKKPGDTVTIDGKEYTLTSTCDVDTDEPEDKVVTPPTGPPSKGSGSGDPHFKTWTGDKYDYHGECDLVLVDNPAFMDGLGLRVHIRTTRVKFFSYIEKVAVQIGEDVLEFDNDVENFYINGALAETNVKHHKTKLGGFIVRRDPKALSIRLHDVSRHENAGRAAKIDLHTRKNGFPAVIVDGGETDVFKGSLGLLGDWATGKRLARDGKTEIKDDATAFALEWQVRGTEPMLFKDIRAPQYPTTCTPPMERESFRLGHSNFQKEAEKACAHWKEDMEDCIFDVIATRDVMVAEEGHIIHIQ